MTFGRMRTEGAHAEQDHVRVATRQQGSRRQKSRRRAFASRGVLFQQDYFVVSYQIIPCKVSLEITYFLCLLLKQSLSTDCEKVISTRSSFELSVLLERASPRRL